MMKLRDRDRGGRGAASGRRDIGLGALAAFLLLVGLDLPGAALAQSAPITITLAGQSMIRSDLRAASAGQLASMRALLKGDVVFTNLEGAIAEPGQTVQRGRGFLAPPQAIDALQALGVNLLALSDNHALDLGPTGVANTLRETARRHLVHAGIGETLAEAAAPAYLKTPNGTVALVASASGLLAPDASATTARPGVNELHVLAGNRPNEATADLPDAAANHPDEADARRILQAIREARRHADLVIVYQHNHVFGNTSFNALFSEALPERMRPNAWLVRWVHAEIDAGADIVVMHGAPLLHGVEIYRGKPIFYDLGNFIYNVPPALTYIDEPIAWESAVAHVQFRHGRLQSLSLQPVVLNRIGSGQPDVHSEYTNNLFLDTRGLPAVATGAKAHYILERLVELSRPFGTHLEIRGDSALLR